MITFWLMEESSTNNILMPVKEARARSAVSGTSVILRWPVSGALTVGKGSVIEK